MARVMCEFVVDVPRDLPRRYRLVDTSESTSTYGASGPDSTIVVLEQFHGYDALGAQRWIAPTYAISDPIRHLFSALHRFKFVPLDQDAPDPPVLDPIVTVGASVDRVLAALQVCQGSSLDHLKALK